MSLRSLWRRFSTGSRGRARDRQGPLPRKKRVTPRRAQETRDMAAPHAVFKRKGTKPASYSLRSPPRPALGTQRWASPAAFSPSSLPLPPSRHQQAHQRQPPIIQLCGGPKAQALWPGLAHPPATPGPSPGTTLRHSAASGGALTTTSTFHSSPASPAAAAGTPVPAQRGPTSAPSNGGPIRRTPPSLPIHTHPSGLHSPCPTPTPFASPGSPSSSVSSYTGDSPLPRCGCHQVEIRGSAE